MSGPYLFNLSRWPEARTMNASELEAASFGPVWRIRSFPYKHVTDGDVIYIGDAKDRRIHWEALVTDLVTEHYGDKRELFVILDARHGHLRRHDDYYRRTDKNEGYLLAWRPKVVRSLDVELPRGFRFGQNAYRRLTDDDITRIGLP